MAPDIVSSSYKQYKNDTSAFTTWLGAAAAVLGWKSSSQSTTALDTKNNHQTAPQDAATSAPGNAVKKSLPKGAKLTTRQRMDAKRAEAAARKEAKAAGTSRDEAKTETPLDESDIHVDTVNYAVPIRDIREQVAVVELAKDTLRMPGAIKWLLERAIKAREEFADWFEEAQHDGDASDASDGDGHRYFISLLRDALVRLSPDLGASTDGGERSAQKSHKKLEINPDLCNRFASLELYSVEPSTLLSPADVALQAARADSTRKADIECVNVYEPEKQQTDDVFELYCFFNDLERYNTSIAGVWQGVCKGETSLMTATCVIHAVISTVRQQEQSMCARIFPSKAPDDCMEDIIRDLAGTRRALEHESHLGGGDSADQRQKVAGGHRQLFPPIYYALSRFIQVQKWTARRSLVCKPPAPAWPTWMPTLDGWEDLFQDNSTPILSPKDTRDADDLTQILLDLQLLDVIETYQAKGGEIVEILGQDPALVQEDVLTRALRPAWREGKLSATTTFAAQLLINLHNSAVTAEAIPRFDYQFSKTHRFVFLSSAVNFQNHRDDRTSMSVQKYLRNIDAPRFSSWKLWLLQARRPSDQVDLGRGAGPGLVVFAQPHDELKGKIIQHSPVPQFALERNPLLTGSSMLRLLLEQYEAGIKAANDGGGILIAAHIYNALRQLELLDKPWPLMDRIIELHKGPIFANAVPATVEEIVARMRYRIPSKHKSTRWHLPKAPGAEALRQLLDKSVPDERALSLVHQEILGRHAEPDQLKRCGAHSQQQQQQRRPAPPSPEELVMALDQGVSTLLEHLTIDYAQLTTMCISGLFTFSKQCATHFEAPNLFFGCGRKSLRDLCLVVAELAVILDQWRDGGHQGRHLMRGHHFVQEHHLVQRHHLVQDSSSSAAHRTEQDADCCGGRYGCGFAIAARVFEELTECNPTFPLKLDEAEFNCPGPFVSICKDREETRKNLRARTIGHPANRQEFDKLLEDNQFVIVDFYDSDNLYKCPDRTCRDMVAEFATLAFRGAVEENVKFAAVDYRAQPELTREQCGTDFLLYKSTEVSIPLASASSSPPDEPAKQVKHFRQTFICYGGPEPVMILSPDKEGLSAMVRVMHAMSMATKKLKISWKEERAKMNQNEP